ncbi:MAG: RtcB family protein [Kiritimatiellia bacterium]|nr:RtcB family protein [Lentisphaerota bacterium]
MTTADFSPGSKPGTWIIPASGHMLVPVEFYATRPLLETLDSRVITQIKNVATLPGIVEAAVIMPDGHQGYGFPIGGVAAFDQDRGGVISAGGVGFDIACGVRTLLTGIPVRDLPARAERLADRLAAAIPAGVGSRGLPALPDAAMRRMLSGGAHWAVEQGFGNSHDLERIEDGGCLEDADPAMVSPRATERQRTEMGTLGSGNHYLEVQHIAEIIDAKTAAVFGLHKDEIVVSLHCGSRGLGHQVATDYARTMLEQAGKHGLCLPDRELACAPIKSSLGHRYLGAMRAAGNCALANRQIIAALVRRVFNETFGSADLPLLYDVSHNLCRVERHAAGRLHVHRKGATRSLPPGHPRLCSDFQAVGQPVLVGGSMGTSSYILAGHSNAAFASACHGAGRRLSRTQAARRWQGAKVVNELRRQAIIVRGQSGRGLAEEAPGAYKDIDQVIAATVAAGLARTVARLEPLICIKG